MKKNNNAKLVEEMIDIIDSSRIHLLTDEEFKKHQKGIVRDTIKYQDSIGNSKFGTCKELKEYIIKEKINDIDNDSNRQMVNKVLKSKSFHDAVIENIGYDYWLHKTGRWTSDEKMKYDLQFDFRYGFVTIKGIKVPIAPPQVWENFEYGEDFDYFIKQVINKNHEYAKKYENEIANCYKNHPEWI